MHAATIFGGDAFILWTKEKSTTLIKLDEVGYLSSVHVLFVGGVVVIFQLLHDDVELLLFVLRRSVVEMVAVVVVLIFEGLIALRLLPEVK